MASVYILFSKNLNKYYVGSCKDLAYRMDQHLNKDYIKSFTAKADDWMVFWHIDNLGYDQARIRPNFENVLQGFCNKSS